MTKREVIRTVLEGRRPPYVPWSFDFTKEAREALVAHLGTEDIDTAVGNHILKLGRDIGIFEPLGDDLFRDNFGVVWDRSIDKDIGNVRGAVLPEPTLKGYAFPDPRRPPVVRRHPGEAPSGSRTGCRVFLHRVLPVRAGLVAARDGEPDAWTSATIREFVRELFRTIADYNIAQVRGGAEVRYRRRLFRRRLGPPARAAYGVPEMAGVHLP